MDATIEHTIENIEARDWEGDIYFRHERRSDCIICGRRGEIFLKITRFFGFFRVSMCNLCYKSFLREFCLARVCKVCYS